MNQITQQTNYEACSIEELKQFEADMIGLFNYRKATKPNDYFFSDEENLVLDTVRFFITKKENQNDSVKIGDMFYTNWGYEQTNTEHFKIVKISPTGKTCQVVQIGSKTVPGSEYSHGMADMVEPDSENELDYGTCQVKIERSSAFNPITQHHEKVKEFYLRGSVWYARGNGKHLQSLYRCKGANYRSWYA